jgi:hypothetical protein
MKYLGLLEGDTEKAFIELLMDKGMFKISVDDMLDLRPHKKGKLFQRYMHSSDSYHQMKK